VSVELVPRAESLDVALEQDTENETITATVTQYGDPVENASVAVDPVDDNDTYAGTGNYSTDADGTVSLLTPDQNVTVNITATEGDLMAATSGTLVAVESLSVGVNQSSEGDATVTVTLGDDPVENASVTVETIDYNGTYDGVGEYATDADGEVGLPAPGNDSVDVRVTASADGDTAETTATLSSQGELASEDAFGQNVSSFVQQLRESGVSGPMGLYVVDYIMEQKAGGPPEHAQGPPSPEDSPANDGDDAENDDETGNETAESGDGAGENDKPADAGKDKDGKANGKDKNNGNGNEKGDDDGADDSDEEDDETDSDDGDASDDDSDGSDDDSDGSDDDSDDDDGGSGSPGNGNGNGNGNGKAKGR